MAEIDRFHMQSQYTAFKHPPTSNTTPPRTITQRSPQRTVSASRSTLHPSSPVTTGNARPKSARRNQDTQSSNRSATSLTQPSRSRQIDYTPSHSTVQHSPSIQSGDRNNNKIFLSHTSAHNSQQHPQTIPSHKVLLGIDFGNHKTVAFAPLSTFSLSPLPPEDEKAVVCALVAPGHRWIPSTVKVKSPNVIEVGGKSITKGWNINLKRELYCHPSPSTLENAYNFLSTLISKINRPGDVVTSAQDTLRLFVSSSLRFSLSFFPLLF